MSKHAWLHIGSLGWAASIALCWCQFTSFVTAQNTTSHPPLAKPDYRIYHSKEEALRQIEWIAGRNPSILRVEDLKAGNAEYTSTMKVVTAEPSGLSEDHRNKIRMLLDFGEHGRELVTVEVAIRLLELLADPSRIEAMAVARGGSPQRLLRLLERCVFKIIPMENIHGRETVEGSNLCERKNGRGVDSNRNWPVHWGFREKDYDPAEEYPGLSPFSEPEVQILDSLAKGFEPHVWMNMHSGMEALFMPYDHLAAIPDDVAGKISFALLQQLNTLKCGGRCAVGSGGKSVGYLAHGTATDYMHDVLGVPFSFTWEIYGDMSAHFNDCFRMFNPLTAEHLEEVVLNWADALLALIELMPASEESSKLAAEGSGRVSFLHRRFLPTALAAQEVQVYNHTETDTAAGLRKARLAEVYTVVAEVDQAIGLGPADGAWQYFSGVPTAAWVLLTSLGFLFFGLCLGRSLLSYRTARKTRTWQRRHEAVL